MNIKNLATGVAATVLAATATNAEPIGSGLAAYLTFDDAVVSNRIPNSTITGVTLSDSGIESGVTNGEFGHFGFGGYLDINQGWARLDGSQNLTFENGNDFTICIWMRMEDAPTGDPAFVGNGSWSHSVWPGTLLYAQSTWVGLNYSIEGISRVRPTTGTVPTGEWHFYAISHTSDGKFHFYMSDSHGTLTVVAENDAPNFKLLEDAVVNRRPFYLGQDGTGTYVYPFVGKLDEFALWTRGLPFSDINVIYQNGRREQKLGDLLKPEMSVVDAGGGTINLSFSGVRNSSYELCVASGGADGGTDRFAWDYFDRVATIAPTDSAYAFALPTAFKNEGRYYRFFLTRAMDYQEIEYVENTGDYDSGSSYFTTTIIPTKDTSVYGEVEFETIGSGTWRNIFGCADGRYFQFGVHNNSAPYDWYTEIRKLESAGNTYMGEVMAGTHYAFDFCVTKMTVRNVSAGTTVSTELLSPDTTFADMSSPMTVFRCMRSNGVIYDRPFTGKLYEFSIFTNGMVACDYIPVKNVSGEVGFYDMMSNAFYPSETATPFAGGAVTVGRLTVQSATAKAMTANDPVAAYWIGGTSDDVDDPASWHCENSYGETIEAIPSLLTDITVSNVAQMFNVSANSSVECKSVTITVPIILTGDCDWRGLDFSKVTAGTIDLSGHKFSLSATANFNSAVSFTDTVGGGELHISVPANVTVDTAMLPLAGALTLVKDGDGTLVASRQGQTFSGGVNVNGGTLKTTAFINTRVLGPSGAKVTVGSCGTLRIEDGFTGLEDYRLELAGGTLYFYNGKTLSGRTSIGNMTLTADSTIRVESVIANDNLCDVEIAEAAVWNLGGYDLTIELMTSNTDFYVGHGKTVKPVFRNGTIILPSQIGYWQDWGSDASDHVRYRFGMKYPRQRADSSTYDFVNNIPSEGSNFSNDGTMSIYGTYTPHSDVCSKLRMMDGSTIDLSDRTSAWTMHGGVRPMTFESGATVNIAIGRRRLAQDEKIISWSAIPSGIKFVDPSRRWGFIAAADGLYAVRGFCMIIR